MRMTGMRYMMTASVTYRMLIAGLSLKVGAHTKPPECYKDGEAMGETVLT